MKIILTGYMASGKTSVGRAVADRLDITFIDLDHLISNSCGISVAELIREKGEIYFRKIEHQKLFEIMESNEDLIISLGGGTPCYTENHLVLERKDVQSFYLKGSPQLLAERLRTDREDRPLIAAVGNNDLAEFVAQHLFERSYYYHMAKHVIRIDGKSVAEIAEAIVHYSRR